MASAWVLTLPCSGLVGAGAYALANAIGGTAGLPAIFAVGMYSLSRGPGVPKTQTGGADSDAVVGGSVAGMVVAAHCFLIVLAAIGWGIYEIYQIGHPAGPAVKSK